MSPNYTALDPVDVLVVDDIPEILRVVTRALKQQRLTVHVAKSALHALQVLESYTVGVVLADQNMPGPSGMLLLDTIARRWPHTRRVLMSSDVPFSLVLEATSAHRVVDKNYPLSQIVEAVVEELRHVRP